MCKRFILFILVFGVIAGLSSVASAQIITAVAQRNPDGDAPEPPEIAEPLVEEAEAFVDRVHQYEQIPLYLIGLQYVKTANDNKDQPGYELDVTISQLATVYLFLDNRLGGAGGGELTNPNLVAAGMTWVTDLGFTDTDDNIAFDEGADGDIDQWSSVFSGVFPAGTITFLDQDDGGGRNMYGVAAAPPPMTASNPTPPDGSTIDGFLYLDNIYVALNFDAGYDAQAHEVFFSEFESLVTALDPSVSLGEAPDPLKPTEFFAGVPLPEWTPYTDSLVRGTTYYWRAVEYDSNGVDWPGPVWSFYVALTEASNPNPPDNMINVPYTPTLSWGAGVTEGYLAPHGHDVYFGTTYVDVNNATTSSPLYRGKNAWTDLDWEPNSDGGLPALDPNTDYYWRIDETHGTAPFDEVLKGDVWKFTTIPVFTIDDPNILAWWRLDETMGDTILDHSGYGHHGTLSGDPARVVGMINQAVEFNGSDQYGGIMGFSGPNDINEVTYCMWVKADVITGNHKMWFTNESSGFGRVRCRVNNGNWGFQHGQGATGNNIEVTSPATADVWTHFAGVRINNDSLELFIDGVSMATTPFLVPGAQANPSSIGGEWRGGTDLRHMFDGVIDDVRVYDHALTASEVVKAASPPEAWAPTPPDGALIDPADYVEFEVTWKSGADAAQHEVYWGTSPASLALVATKTRSEPNYAPDEGIEFGETYYWQIVETNNPSWPGPIWSFTTVREAGMGSIVVERWLNLQDLAVGNNIDDLKNDLRFPDNPDETYEVTRFHSGTG
ncbi:MAG: LamG domain-containing protein, partial [Planctomycetota bacterium]